MHRHTRQRGLWPKHQAAARARVQPRACLEAAMSACQQVDELPGTRARHPVYIQQLCATKTSWCAGPLPRAQPALTAVTSVPCNSYVLDATARPWPTAWQSLPLSGVVCLLAEARGGNLYTVLVLGGLGSHWSDSRYLFLQLERGQ